MKALLKIGFVLALCMAGSAAYGQTPEKKAEVVKTGREPQNMGPRKTAAPAKPAPKAKTVVKAQPARKAEVRYEKEEKY